MEWEIHDFNFSGDSAYSETALPHPAIIFKVIEGTTIAFVIPLTSKVEKSYLPFTVIMKKNDENHLVKDSLAEVFQMRSIDFRRIKSGSIGNVDEAKRTEIKQVLKRMFEL